MPRASGVLDSTMLARPSMHLDAVHNAIKNA